jgi:tetratricopeptide (TPR) repeat protein
MPCLFVDLAYLSQNIGNYHQDTGNLVLMLQSYQQMMDIQTALCAAEPDNARFKNGLAISYYKLAEISNTQKDHKKAKTYFQEAEKL